MPKLKVDDIGPVVPAGLPSDLLARRPDIRQAESDLVAASARIDEARAQYFPAITLTARFGSESSESRDLFSGPGLVWRVAGSLFQPLFNAGRIGSQVDAATSGGANRPNTPMCVRCRRRSAMPTTCW